MNGFPNPQIGASGAAPVSAARGAFAALSAPRTLGGRSQGRDNHFNLVRFGAAAAVLVSHAWPIALGQAAQEPLERALDGKTLGGIAVMIFFAVSGYFIAQSFDRSRSVGVFLAARALRLFPALAVMLVLSVVMGAALTVAPPGTYWPGAADYVLRGITLVAMHYDLPGVFGANPFGAPVNGSLWTLRYEVACYGMVLIVGRSRLAARWVALGIVAVLAGLSGLGPVTVLHSGAVAALAELALPFWIGSTLYFWRDRVPHSVVVLAALIVIAVASFHTPLREAGLAAAIGYGAIWAGFAQARPLLAFNRIGDFSYGIYIYAFPVQQLAAHLGAVTPWQNIIWAAPVVLVLAALSWSLVEEPALRLKPRMAAQPAKES